MATLLPSLQLWVPLKKKKVFVCLLWGKGMGCVWRSEVNLQKSFLPFYQMGPRAQTQVSSIYLLSHPVRSWFLFLFGGYILFIF